MKNVLILCTGNSCRSIMAEALINARMDERYRAYSSGVRASGRVNPNAKQLLEEKGIWHDEYHSKALETMMERDYDLIVTVCDHAHETCPTFPRPVPTLHVGFDDPDGKSLDAFEATYRDIETILLPKIEAFFQPVEKTVIATDKGVKIHFTGGIAKNTVFTMVQNCQNGQCECMSDETKAKIASMEVRGDDGSVEIDLQGAVTAEEIEAALSRSKVLPDCGC